MMNGGGWAANGSDNVIALWHLRHCAFGTRNLDSFTVQYTAFVERGAFQEYRTSVEGILSGVQDQCEGGTFRRTGPVWRGPFQEYRTSVEGAFQEYRILR